MIQIADTATSEIACMEPLDAVNMLGGWLNPMEMKLVQDIFTTKYGKTGMKTDYNET